MGRRSILAVVAAVAVLSAGLGWVLGQRIKSPAEIAADAAPPDPSLITVPVEQRELSSRVVVRGTVVSSGSTAISVLASAEGASLITRLPLEAGDPLEEGDVVIEVAGDPVIVLQGELPEYRSLAPGMDGPDVKQLEVALTRLGYDVGDVDDLYTPATGRAVAELYEDGGYKADAPSRDELDLVETAESQVDQLQKQLNNLSSSGSSGLPKSRLLQLNLAIEQAKEALADAKATKTSDLVDLKQARDDAVAAKSEAHNVLKQAQARLAQAEGGAHPDTGQPPTAEELAVLSDAVATATATATQADDVAAQTASAYDQGAVFHDRAIRDADVEVKVAEAAKAEALQPVDDGSGSATSAADIRKQLTKAREDLADLRATTGVRLPAAHFRFVKTLPSVVQSVDAKLGDSPTGPVMTVSGASTILESSVAESDWRLIDVGAEGVAEDDDLGISVGVRISELASQPGGGESGSSGRYAMVLTPLDDVPEEAMFESLRITIPISSTGGEVLAVPLAAVSAGSDGSSRVEVERDDGSTELVTVTTGLSAEGFVEVRPVGGELEAGDRVVVGRDLLLPSEDDAGSNSDGDNSDSEEEDGEAYGVGGYR